MTGVASKVISQGLQNVGSMPIVCSRFNVRSKYYGDLEYHGVQAVCDAAMRDTLFICSEGACNNRAKTARTFVYPLGHNNESAASKIGPTSFPVENALDAMCYFMCYRAMHMGRSSSTMFCAMAYLQRYLEEVDMDSAYFDTAEGQEQCDSLQLACLILADKQEHDICYTMAYYITCFRTKTPGENDLIPKRMAKEDPKFNRQCMEYETKKDVLDREKKAQIQDCEGMVCYTLDWKLQCMTPYLYLDLFLRQNWDLCNETFVGWTIFYSLVLKANVLVGPVYSTGAISYVAMHLALRHMSTQQELYLQELVWFYCLYERYIGKMEETDKLVKLCIQVYNLN